ncbi:hypothetical protein ACJU26_13810 [Acidithiobacillus sp. M4-SHS-6]|uniref:hypothetical protein n=1 Tax=Acidithiobacillus sp. M4-SHS-6 TaxID=3383024 RepID=UPI0039BDD586
MVFPIYPEEDFQVTEILPFALSGAGAHHWLWIEERGLNTQEVDAARRALRARPDALEYHWKDAHSLVWAFSLPAGIYCRRLRGSFTGPGPGAYAQT